MPDHALPQCVVLAGGLGTRMLPETAAIPKTLLSVAGQPFAHWQLRWLHNQGVRDVLYSVGHLGAQVRDFVGDGSSYGLRVRWVYDGDVLLGTAGALRKALDLGLLDREFVVTYGDSYLTLDMANVVAAHRAAGRPALMTVFGNDNSLDASNAIVADGRVVLYDKELGNSTPPPKMRWIDYGLSVLDRSVISDQVKVGATADLAPIFRSLSLAGKLTSYEVTQRFYEIGSPQGRADCEDLLTSASRSDRSNP